MPLMRPPPKFVGSYNGLRVDAVAKPDDLVNVLPQDVACHEAEGWELVADSTLTVPAAVSSEGDDHGG